MSEDAPTTGIGATLRDTREAQGRSLEDVALSLRARVSQLEALEREAFDGFGGDVYAKGFLRNYAQELGLDPTPLLDTFRREVSHDDVHAASRVSDVSTPKEGRGAPPAWIGWLLAIIVVVAGIAVLGSTDGRAPDQSGADEPIGPPPVTAEDDPNGEDTDPEPEPEPEPDTETAPEPEPEPEPETEPTFDGVELFLAFESASWVRVVADEAPVLEQTVDAGETLQFEAEREIEVRFGNPGGVRATLNGEDLGPQGSPGQPITVRFTPDGVEAV